MWFWRSLLVAGLVALLLSSCCVLKAFEDDDDVSPAPHSEGTGESV